VPEPGAGGIGTRTREDRLICRRGSSGADPARCSASRRREPRFPKQIHWQRTAKNWRAARSPHAPSRPVLSPINARIGCNCILGRLDGCRYPGDTWRLRCRNLLAEQRDGLGFSNLRGNAGCLTEARVPLGKECNDAQQIINGFGILHERWIEVFNCRERILVSRCGSRVEGSTNHRSEVRGRMEFGGFAPPLETSASDEAGNKSPCRHADA